MNRSMLMGLVGGIGIATAGGVAGYALMSQSDGDQTGTSIVEETAVTDTAAEAAAMPAGSQPSAAPVQAVAPAPAPAPRAAAAPARTQAAAPAPAPAPAPASVFEERCWDEEVVVQADPKDDKAIAGTATGAIIGGALAKRLGDDNDLVTAAGAAAGALGGRRIQRNIQENNTTTVIERRCETVQL